MTTQSSSPTVRTVVLSLGFTQAIAWASSTYLPAILATPIARDLGISRSTVFAAFSASLLVMATLGPAIGRTIDRRGGRGVLVCSNLTLAFGLLTLGIAHSELALFVAWAILGAGMALGLYDAAFSALVKVYGTAARSPITGITLLGGFASTVGWPLTAYLENELGWRATCFVWAALHICIALPLNWRFVPAGEVLLAAPVKLQGSAHSPPERPKASKRAFAWMAVYFAATSFVTSAYAAHLPTLLVALGTSPSAALVAASLLGPAQVAARLAEFGVVSRFGLQSLTLARIATLMHPVAAVMLLILGGGASPAAAFVLLHGAGNGMITIAKGTLPLSVFGPFGYGRLQGWLAVCGRLMQAAAPLAFSLLIEGYGGRIAMLASGLFGLVSLAALFALRQPVRDI